MTRLGRTQRQRAIFWHGANTAITFLGDAMLQAVVTFTSEGVQVHTGESSLQGVAAFTAEGSRIFQDADALMQSVATMDPQGAVGLSGDVTLQGVATLQGTAATGEGEATLQSVTTLIADAAVVQIGETALVGVATLTADAGGALHEGEAHLQGVAHMGFDPEHVSPSPPWGSWSTTVARRRIVPGRHRREKLRR